MVDNSDSKKTITRTELIQNICRASQQGMLGLFLGSGFSKAVVGERALSWGELLDRSYDRLNKLCTEVSIPFEPKDRIFQKGYTFPVIAAKISQAAVQASKKIETEQEKDDAPEEIKKIRRRDLDFKEIVADLVSIYPKNDALHDDESKWKASLEKLDIRWVITTNYDHIIECLLAGRAMTLYPNQVFTSPKGLVPVFHLHGSIWQPENMVITNEDYVQMLRPSDYRQTRLPSLLKESTVLMAGYALGDLNVLSAIDWCSNVKADSIPGYNQQIVFVKYVEDNPKAEPYYDDDTNIIVIETSDLQSFFADIAKTNSDLSQKYANDKIAVDNLMKKFVSVKSFKDEITVSDIENLERALSEIKKLSEDFPYLTSGFLLYLQAFLAKIDEQSRKYNAFDQYDIKLQTLIMLMHNIDDLQLPDSYIVLFCTAFNDVAFYFDEGIHTPGKAWDATETWKRSKRKIPQELMSRMKRYCDNNANHLFYAKKWLA